MNTTLTNSTDAVAYILAQGGLAPNQTMVDVMEKTQAIQYRAWLEDGRIKGLRVFMRVINPFRREMGFALIEDYANGHDIQPETATPENSA
jgi:hypothetical protein